MNLVDATTVQRLLSWLVDSVPLLILSVIFLPMISAKMLASLSSPQIMGEIAGIYTVFGLLSLAYTGFLWWWEATVGKSVGNLLLGLRTTNLEGAVPGWGKTIGRRLLIAAAGIVPVLGPILMVISNHFDANNKKQGWHDKAAGTLVLDIKTGRDPLVTGGMDGLQSFAPQPSNQQATPGPAVAPEQSKAAAGEVEVIDSVPGAVRTPKPQPEEVKPEIDAGHAVGAAQADEEDGYTKIRTPAPQGARLVFDDQRRIELEGSILLGRNPSHGEGDIGVRLVALEDPERSVSKTHVLIQPGSGCIWVTDRGSGNGTQIVDGQGAVRTLQPSKPEQARVGDTVRLGDRYFVVEQP